GITWTPGRTYQNNPWIQDPANQPTLSAGVVLRWNLDIAGNVFRTRRAEAQLAQTRAQAEAAGAGISLEAEIAVSRIEDARRREAAWDTGERETRAWFIGLAQAYDVGAAEPRDLIDALKGYFEARFSHLQARMDFNVAAANLERMTGQPVIPMSDWEPACD
ncbi:MAG: TolC family protein, partial [Myxococcota bacterium]